MQAANSGGNHVCVSAKINDDNGATVTVASNAVPGTILHASLYTEEQNTSLGGITFDGTTGVFTVAKDAMAGKYLVQAVAGNAIGGNAANYSIEIFHNSSIAGAAARKVEPATAIQSSVGPAVAIVDLVDADTVSVRIRVGTNGDAVTLRDFHVSLLKIA